LNGHFRTHNDNYDDLNKKLFTKIPGVAGEYKLLKEMMTIEVVNYLSESIICKQPTKCTSMFMMYFIH
jgi:hypothetical protein